MAVSGPWPCLPLPLAHSAHILDLGGVQTHGQKLNLTESTKGHAVLNVGILLGVCVLNTQQNDYVWCVEQTSSRCKDWEIPVN